jgi:hypothetical protein
VGRERERDEFLVWLRQGSSRLAVWGGPGVGKTTFISEMAGLVPAEYQVFQYTLNEWSTPREFLNHLAIFLGEDRLKGIVENRQDISPAEAHHVLERSLDGSKVLFMIDDCQRMEPRMESLLEGLSRIPNAKVVLSGREIGHIECPVSIEIGGLDRESACLLLAGKGSPMPDMERVLSMTGGNPLALELVTGLDTRSYTDLSSLIDNEVIPNLSQRDQEVLSFLSVLRYPFKPEVLGSLYGIDGSSMTEWERKRYSDRLDEMVKRSFLTYSGESYRMHDLLRDLFYRVMGDEDRTGKHRLASNYYITLENDPARIEVLYHFVNAGMFKEAMETLSNLSLIHI